MVALVSDAVCTMWLEALQEYKENSSSYKNIMSLIHNIRDLNMLSGLYSIVIFLYSIKTLL